MNNSKIFCAIDTPDLNRAIELASTLKNICGIKLGLEFFNAYGVTAIHKVMAAAGDSPLFLDLKYHDIPNTVAGAIRAVTKDLKPAFINVHASGGYDMMKAAVEACPIETKLLAVTVLTSIDAKALNQVGQGDNSQDQVRRLAVLAKEAGCYGVVCSSHEIEIVRDACGDDFVTMVPGIRPAGSDQGDQKRIMTPKDAIDRGATHLVIGRPITQSEHPNKAAQSILESMK